MAFRSPQRLRSLRASRRLPDQSVGRDSDCPDTHLRAPGSIFDTRDLRRHCPDRSIRGRRLDLLRKPWPGTAARCGFCTTLRCVAGVTLHREPAIQIDFGGHQMERSIFGASADGPGDQKSPTPGSVDGPGHRRGGGVMARPMAQGITMKAFGIFDGPSHHHEAALGIFDGPSHQHEGGLWISDGSSHHHEAALEVFDGSSHHHEAALGIFDGPSHQHEGGLWISDGSSHHHEAALGIFDGPSLSRTG